MMKRIAHIIVTIIFLTGCNNKPVKDLSEVEQLLSVTDSLLQEVQGVYNRTSAVLYKIPEDSLLVDSLIKILNLPDTIGFYQYLESSIFEYSEMIDETKQEIYFVKDQLSSIKSEYIDNKLSDSEFINEIIEVYEVIEFLQQRVDSNMSLIYKRYELLLPATNDSIGDEKSE